MSATRLVLRGLGPVGLLAGALMGIELIDAPVRWLVPESYRAVAQTHAWMLFACLAAIPVALCRSWRAAGIVAAPWRLRSTGALVTAAVPLGLALVILSPKDNGASGLAVVLVGFGLATVLGASEVLPTERRAALLWAGAVVLGSGLLHAGATIAAEPLGRWALLSRAGVMRAVLVGLPFTAAVRQLDLSKATGSVLAASLVVFTVAEGPVQPLRVVCAAVALKLWRQSSCMPSNTLARTWLLGATGLVLVSECGAAVVGLDDPFVSFTYVPVAQAHYLAASGFAALAAVFAPSRDPRTESRGAHVWALAFIIGAHLACGALLLLGRAGMPRLYVGYFASFEPLFRVTALGATLTAVAALRIAWTWRRAPAFASAPAVQATAEPQPPPHS